MVRSTPIPPFAKPSSPPRPLIVLLSATDLDVPNLRPLLAHEDLNTSQSVLENSQRHTQRRCFHPYPRPIPPRVPSLQTNVPSTSHTVMQRRPPSPTLSGPPHNAIHPRTPSSPIQHPDHNSFTPQARTFKHKIKRPKGAGRKNCINWEDPFFQRFRKSTHILMVKHLNPSHCFMDQDPVRMEKVRAELLIQYPELDDYENMWPLEQLLISLLKYSSSKARQSSAKRTVDALRETAGMPSDNSTRCHHKSAGSAP